MKIAITATAAALDAETDERFGRAPWILIADTGSGMVQAYDNSDNQAAQNGAGIQAASQLAELQVDLLYTGHVGPKAADVLREAGIDWREGIQGSVEQALETILTDLDIPGPDESGQSTPIQDLQPAPEGATRLAIPADSEQGLDAPRSGHFGRCAWYILCDIKDGQIVQAQALPNAGHQQGACMAPVQLLSGAGVQQLVVAGIGGRPLAGFQQVGIDVLQGGDSPRVADAVQAWIQGQLPRLDPAQACGGSAH